MLARRPLPVLFLLVLQASRLSAFVCAGHGNQSTMVVSAEWLEAHGQDKTLVVLAVGDQKGYLAGHVPGSRYLEYSDFHTSPPAAGSSALILELPSLAQAAEVLAKVGVSDGSRIILYSTNDNAAVTARVYLTLDAMGLGASTSILDGGMPLWKREGHAVSQDVPTVVPGHVHLCPQTDVVANLDDVRSQLHTPKTTIVDSRLSEFYTGEKIPQGRRAGHIPGAANIPFSSLVDESGRLLPARAIQEKFEKAGVQPGSRVITYCHIGQQASLVYFAARYLGYDARMFDGSWQEWSAHEELPAETSPGKTPSAQH